MSINFTNQTNIIYTILSKTIINFSYKSQQILAQMISSLSNLLEILNLISDGT